jgi:hypothetical protein
MTKQNESRGEKDDLLAEIQNVKAEADRGLNKGQQIVAECQYMKDFSDAAMEYLKLIPSDASLSGSYWENNKAVWKWARNGLQEFNDKSESHIKVLTQINSYTTSPSADFFKPPNKFNIIPDISVHPSILEAISKFNEVADRAEWVTKAEEELVRLRLDSGYSGEKSPLELLRQARESYLKPSSGEIDASTTLIPLREAINSAIKDLLRRRPSQEKAKNIRDKILSIGLQTREAHVNDADIEKLADQAEHMIDDLSKGKGGSLSRDEVRTLFIGGTSFLTAFLNSIDSAKLKS